MPEPSVNVTSAIRTSEEELVSVTNDLAKVVSEVCEQIKYLKEERSEAIGETKNAYNLVIANKVWILQRLIGAYWRETLTLELDKPEVVPTDLQKEIDAGSPTTTVLTWLHPDDGANGPTGC